MLGEGRLRAAASGVEASQDPAPRDGRWSKPSPQEVSRSLRSLTRSFRIIDNLLIRVIGRLTLDKAVNRRLQQKRPAAPSLRRSANAPVCALVLALIPGTEASIFQQVLQLENGSC